MTIKTYSDGSELTATNLAGALAVSAIAALAATYCVAKYDDWKERRIMKKYGWPPIEEK